MNNSISFINQGTKNKKIEYVSLLFCSLFSLSGVVTVFCMTLRSFIGYVNNIDKVVFYIIIAYFFFRSLPKILAQISLKDVMFWLILISVYCFSMLISPEANSIQLEVAKDFIHCIAFYFVARSVHGNDKMLMYLKLFGWLVMIACALDIFWLRISFSEGNYSQYFGYVIYTGYLMLLVPTVRKPKIVHICALAFCLFMIVIYGARGPFVLAVLSTVLMLFFAVKNKKMILYTLCIGAILLIGMLLCFYQKILQFLFVFFTSKGYGTRTLELLIDGAIFEDSSRSQIAEHAIDYISTHIFYGSGLVADRVIINNSYSVFFRNESAIGTYPHNFFLEVLMQFGVIFGLVLILAFFILLWKAYKQQRTKTELLFFLMLFCVGFLPLMVSGSYVANMQFFGLLGFCIGTMEQIKQKKRVKL